MKNKEFLESLPELTNDEILELHVKTKREYEKISERLAKIEKEMLRKGRGLGF
jgi:uncharacterized protein YPO0396